MRWYKLLGHTFPHKPKPNTFRPYSVNDLPFQKRPLFWLQHVAGFGRRSKELVMAFCAQHLTTSVPMFELPDSIASAVMWSTKGNLHDQLSIHSWQTSESNWLKKLTLIQSIPQMFIPTIQDTQRNLIQKHLTATGRGKPRVLQTFRWHFLFQLLPWRRRPRPFLRTGCGRLICSQSGSSLGEDQATKGWSLTWIQRESPIPGCHFQVTCHVISMDSSKK